MDSAYESRLTFLKKGHLTFKRMFDVELIRSASDIGRRLFDAPAETYGSSAEFRAETRGLDRIFNAHNHAAVLAQIIHSPALIKMACLLLGCASIRLWYTQLICKYPTEAGFGPSAGQIGWHTDYAYWQGLQPPSLLTCWVPMQETGPETGGILFRSLAESEDPHFVKGFNSDFAKVSDTGSSPEAPRFGLGMSPSTIVSLHTHPRRTMEIDRAWPSQFISWMPLRDSPFQAGCTIR